MGHLVITRNQVALLWMQIFDWLPWTLPLPTTSCQWTCPPTWLPLHDRDSFLTTCWVDRMGDLIPPWNREKERTFAARMYICEVTDHSREKMISHSTCLSMARNVSNEVIVQNVTAEERNWKSTPFVITRTNSRWPVDIIPRCLGSLST